MNIGLVGSVDSGKTTLISVLSTGNLDDGRGGSRGNILVHKHELETGCTSSINVIPMEGGIKLLDLPGHDTYLHTTLSGLSKYHPNFVLVVVDANKAEKCKSSFELLSICKRFGLLCIVVFTKVDTSEEKRLENSIDYCKIIAKKLNYRFFTHIKSENKTFAHSADLLSSGNKTTLPYFLVSNTTGQNISLLKNFLQLLKPIPFMETERKKWLSDKGSKTIFNIYKVYKKEIGSIFFGEVKLGSISVGDTLKFGPFGSEFIDIKIKSIHNSDQKSIQTLQEREQGCIAFKLNTKLPVLKSKSDIKLKKNRLVSNIGFTYSHVLARLDIFQSSVTINGGYTPHIISDHISCNAKIIAAPKYPIRGNQVIRVLLEFSRPQYIYPYTKLLFRDGKVRGVGFIENVMNLTEEESINFVFSEN